jgi:CheY-like chemotaxis protein
VKLLKCTRSSAKTDQLSLGNHSLLFTPIRLTFFMRRALESAAISNPVFVAEDGLKAVDYLAGNGQFSDRTAFPLPPLIFLDLKMPGKKGLDVLAWLRQQDHLRSIVVVILTSSQEPSDLRQAYHLGANSYLVKMC